MTTRSASEFVLVDSSGWLEYATDDLKASDFATYIEGAKPVLVPTIVLFEVYKKLCLVESKIAAQRFESHALRKHVVALDAALALAAAAVSLEHRLPLADAIVYATAQMFQAELVTSDTHFQNLPGVNLI